jgi:spore coat polysaccharide biosynthesis protein SpsF
MLSFRFADVNDGVLYYNWANDPTSRENSYHKNEIKYSDHMNWFTNKLNSKLCFFYLFFNDENIPAGQVRIEKNADENSKEAIISVSVDFKFRGKGFGKEMIRTATDDFLNKFIEYKVIAYVFSKNMSSYKSFINAGFNLVEEKIISGIQSYILFKSK